ncbi:MAG: hypothetical protein ACYC3B_02250 [Sedimentisphaerales bacterium]
MSAGIVMIKTLKRTVTSVLPVSKKRAGNCLRCGQCCKLLVNCPFLRYDAENKSSCSIYKCRPLNCLKYPRTSSESVTADKCGFRFE